jgi:hypothetical protein
MHLYLMSNGRVQVLLFDWRAVTAVKLRTGAMSTGTSHEHIFSVAHADERLQATRRSLGGSLLQVGQ